MYDIFHTHAHCQLFRCVTETGDGEQDYIAMMRNAGRKGQVHERTRICLAVCNDTVGCASGRGFVRRYRVGVVCYKG